MEWIETSKRLPEHYVDVLVVWAGCPFEHDHGPELGYYTVTGACWRHTPTGQCLRHAPTHWMPLPKPPQGK